MVERIRTRFLVVGSGVAGLHTAWRASAGGDVLMLTKRSLFDSATAYAQGGIAAALGAGDSTELHRQDTLAAGAALCDAAAVQVLVDEGPARVRELRAAGARFDLEPGGGFKLGREAAHSRRRIVHAHGDQTGAEVARTLIKRVKASERIEVLEKTRILELIVKGGICYGVRAAVAGKPVEIIADATVLATGGCGQVYRYTTNPQVATGDGYAIAHRAGAKLADMEFVQFHPTALDTPENPLALISEAVRGEGAILLNEELARFMPKRHRLAELAPRKQKWEVPVLRDRGAAQVAADDIRQVMWDHCGIDRTAKGLRLGLDKLKGIESRLPSGATEEANMVQTSRLIADAALLRKESRGGHYRSDFPRAKRKWSGRHIEW